MKNMFNRNLAAALTAGLIALGSAGVAQAGKPADAGKSPVPGKPGAENIVTIAEDVNDSLNVFDYLLSAAKCEGQGIVVGILTGADKVTLFAPTDTAFRSLLGIPQPEGEEPKGESFPCNAVPSATLTNILAYHVTDGRRFSNSVFNERATKMVEMLNEQYIVTNPDLTIIGNGNVDGDGNVDPVDLVKPFININASNGVIHVIDTVLLPVPLP
jgi:transforming growth factor-beta-induced protein